MADRNRNTDTNGKADGAVERIRAYFEANASEDLKRRAAAEGKTAAGALAYAKGQARKLAVGGCACVEDETVYGWAMHYFEDEDAARWEPKKPAAKPSEGEKKTVGAEKPEAETAGKPAEPAQGASAGGTDDGAEERGGARETRETPPPPPAEPKPVQTDLFAALGL